MGAADDASPTQVAQLMPMAGRGTLEGALTHLSGEDYVALHTLMHLYPHYTDRGRYQEVARVTNSATSMAVQIVYPDGTPRTRHTGSNIRITADGPDEAFAYLSFTLPLQAIGEPFTIGITGTWDYRFRRIDGVWYVAEQHHGDARLWGDLVTHLDPNSTEAAPLLPPEERRRR